MAENVIQMALIHRPTHIFIEDIPGTSYFVDFLKLVAREKNIFLPIELVKATRQDDAKNMRVMAFGDVVRKGRFKFFLGLSNWSKLVEQAITFPKGRLGHDDYPDCTAYLYGQLTKGLLLQPVRPRPTGNPIMELINQRETYLTKVLKERELAESDVETTGLD
jgi:hypothetical protein